MIEKLTSFKRKGGEWDLYLSLPIDRFFVGVSGVSTGLRPVYERKPGVFTFEYKRGRYTRIPKTTIESVYSL